MILKQWASRWGVPPEALDDLLNQLKDVNTDPPPSPLKSEAAVQNMIRIEASRAGARLWRNNVGLAEYPDGSFVRYGLANDSKAMNKIIKSSDLIGIKPVLIGPEHIGTTLGQFVAREVKAEGWKFSVNNKREQAQLKFLELIISYGGDACFATGEGTL